MPIYSAISAGTFPTTTTSATNGSFPLIWLSVTPSTLIPVGGTATTWGDWMESRVYPQSVEWVTPIAAPAVRRRVPDPAKRRAHELLMDHLSPLQREAYLSDKSFLVQGGTTKTIYRVRGRGGVVGNVDVMEPGGRVSHRLCAHIDHGLGVPYDDHILAQKLMLEFSEEEFLSIANRHVA